MFQYKNSIAIKIIIIISRNQHFQSFYSDTDVVLPTILYILKDKTCHYASGFFNKERFESMINFEIIKLFYAFQYFLIL